MNGEIVVCNSMKEFLGLRRKSLFERVPAIGKMFCGFVVLDLGGLEEVAAGPVGATGSVDGRRIRGV